jgi:RimJ/RimL family protein N-acetyltransferase
VVDNAKDLKWLKSMDLPVAAWIHENNKDQDLSGAFYALEDPQTLDMDFYEKVYRREKKIPWDIVETKRCIVREMIPKDAVAFGEIYKDPQIQKFMDDFHGDIEGESAYIRDYQQQYRFCEYGIWSILLKDTEEIIGRAGFLQNPSKQILKDMDIPFLGYVIGIPWQRQGLAEEVCRALLKYAEEELDFEKVGLLVEKENVASIKLAEKLGFQDLVCGCQLLFKVLHLRQFKENAVGEIVGR